MVRQTPRSRETSSPHVELKLHSFETEREEEVRSASEIFRDCSCMMIKTKYCYSMKSS